MTPANKSDTVSASVPRQGMERPVATALLALALFAPPIVFGFYDALGRELPDAFPILSQVFFVLSLYTWFSLYSQRHRIAWVLDMGWFLFAAWPVVVPYYILKREGRRGWSRIGLFCLTWFAAWASGIALDIWIRVAVAGD